MLWSVDTLCTPAAVTVTFANPEYTFAEDGGIGWVPLLLGTDIPSNMKLQITAGKHNWVLTLTCFLTNLKTITSDLVISMQSNNNKMNSKEGLLLNQSKFSPKLSSLSRPTCLELASNWKCRTMKLPWKTPRGSHWHYRCWKSRVVRWK